MVVFLEDGGSGRVGRSKKCAIIAGMGKIYHVVWERCMLSGMLNVGC